MHAEFECKNLKKGDHLEDRIANKTKLPTKTKKAPLLMVCPYSRNFICNEHQRGRNLSKKEPEETRNKSFSF